MIVNGVLKFPSNFHFGSATSSFQVEGSSGNRYTDWDKFFAEKNEIVKPSEIGPQWWVKGKAEKDIEQMAGLGLRMQRISFEWARIEPTRGEIDEEAIQRYKEIIKKIIDCGMIPIVTINHFTLPIWIAKQGSWANDKTVGDFAHFAKFIVARFPEVNEWITINEPNILVATAYLSHYFPPRSNSIFKAIAAGKNMWEAHRRAYIKIKRIAPLSKVGVCFAFRWNRAFNHKDIFERFYAHIVNEFSEMSYVRGAPDKMDFIGCNFYTGYFLDLNISKLKVRRIKGIHSVPDTLLFGETKTPRAYLSDYGWPIVPGFFLDLLRKLHKATKKPIYITENGIADADDSHRAYYLITHLVALWRAIHEEIPVENYMHWSTVDNIEWTEGYSKSFGLLALNPITGERKLRKSALLYKEIASKGEIDIERLVHEFLPKGQQDVALKNIQNLLLGKVRLITPEGQELYS